MTLDELVRMPVGMSLEEWKKELTRRKGVNRKIRKMSEEIDFLVDGLEVLRGEVGSERYMKKYNRLFNLLAKRDRLLDEAKEW